MRRDRGQRRAHKNAKRKARKQRQRQQPTAATDSLALAPDPDPEATELPTQVAEHLKVLTGITHALADHLGPEPIDLVIGGHDGSAIALVVLSADELAVSNEHLEEGDRPWDAALGALSEVIDNEAEQLALNGPGNWHMNQRPIAGDTRTQEQRWLDAADGEVCSCALCMGEANDDDAG